ncbi:hypothetical protein SLS64_008638 [Diaporthe eres]|uniref:RNase H type-1 domain-containing protein n=1 Tax=Diaporthe eres TaxID=83184 RepID=A0ABR1PE92_DIAER
MSLNVTIPPKVAAIDAAIAAQARLSPTDTLVLHVYCDGSYKHGSYFKRTRPRAGIGIVANIWLPRDTTKQRTSKACFIRCYRDDDNTTTEALALAEGAYVALQQISRIQILSPIRSTDRIEVIFWSDSTTVLRALEDRTRFQAQSKKTRHLLDIVKLKTYELQDLRADVSILFRWCPQECVEPHETADDLSKQVRFSGGSTLSKSEELFKSGPHSSIESALRQRLESAENPLSPEQTSQQDAAEQIGPHASSSGHPDPYAFIEMAALELPIQHKDVMLAAIDLQKKINAARSQNAPQGQVHKTKDQDSVSEGQNYDSDDQAEKSEGQFHEAKEQDDETTGRVDGHDGQSHEPEGRPGQYDGDIDDNEGLSRESEPLIDENDCQSPHPERQDVDSGSKKDGDVDDEPEVAEEVSPNRMLAMWAWVGRSWVDYRRPHL